jgi:hypothetical protein
MKLMPSGREQHVLRRPGEGTFAVICGPSKGIA